MTLPSAVATSRWQVTPRAAAGAALVLLLAVAVLAGRTVLAERSAAPVPVAGSRTVTSTGDRSAFETGATSQSAEGSTDPSSSAAAPGTASGTLYVHVVGRVRSPGVVEVPAGSRVADAVRKAGGLSSGADTTQVNLARLVVDGEQIVIAREGETPAPASTAGAPAAAPSPGIAPGTPGVTGADQQVSLNTADQATLETLPGVGPVLAQRIIEWRTTNGGFTAVEELNEVSGIGEKLYAQISPKVRV